MVTKLVSSKVVIAQLFQDFNLNGTDWLGSVNRHIGTALELMELSGYFKEAVRVTTVKDHLAPLPCQMKELIAVLDLNDSTKAMGVLPIKNSNFVGNKYKDLLGASYRSGAINFNGLRTSFETGKVAFLYHTPPTDDEGYPLVPDNAFVLEAIPFYIIMRLAYSGVTHPVISREEAEIKWRELYPRARNRMNFPTIQEMDQIVASLADPYYERSFNYSYLNNLEIDNTIYL